MQVIMKNDKSQVKEVEKTLNEEFRAAYSLLPLADYTRVRDEICRAVYWKTSTFYNRLRGDRAIKPLEIPIIRDVFKNYGINVF